MRMYDVIKRKRDGEELTDEEIKFFVSGLVKGDIPNYQATALLMAIYYKGMTERETTALTFSVRDSGEKLDFSDLSGIRVDKHSTGGVGDKTSLTVAPIVATLGLKVAKMSGRGLGHTGGTIDKLESIPNFKTELSVEKFKKIVNDVGVCIVGQTASLAPADKILYALRDVTATVDSLPLIVSSIMGKKLCADDDCIVLDVKTGSGSFMKTKKDSLALAESMVKIGKNAGKKICALITDMDSPLGKNIGNSLEVIEAIEALKGRGEFDYINLCIELSARILFLAKKGSYEDCVKQVKDVLYSGKAFETFAKMVEAQGGDVTALTDYSKFKKAKYTYQVKVDKEGYIYSVNAEDYGRCALVLGAGRNKADDKIDHSAGIVLNKKRGDYVAKGDVLATLYTDNESSIKVAKDIILNATTITDNKPEDKSVVLDIVL